jgi:hypothetical protein
VAIDAVDVDASKPSPMGRDRKGWLEFLSYKKGFVQLDSDIRRRFDSGAAVNNALRKLLEALPSEKRNTSRRSA